jgi:hypothetical protein
VAWRSPISGVVGSLGGSRDLVSLANVRVIEHSVWAHRLGVLGLDQPAALESVAVPMCPPGASAGGEGVVEHGATTPPVGR